MFSESAAQIEAIGFTVVSTVEVTAGVKALVQISFDGNSTFFTQTAKGNRLTSRRFDTYFDGGNDLLATSDRLQVPFTASTRHIMDGDLTQQYVQHRRNIAAMVRRGHTPVANRPFLELDETYVRNQLTGSAWLIALRSLVPPSEDLIPVADRAKGGTSYYVRL